MLKKKIVVLILILYCTGIFGQAATRYSWPGDGDSCRKHGYVSWSVNYDGGYCGAVSEGLFRDLGVSGGCGSSTCSPNGNGCNNCCDESKISPPQCPYQSLCTPESGQQARYICVRCNEGSVCKHRDWVRIGISEACPSAHPCNSCKGYNNPCANGKKTIDLCETSFWEIYSGQVSDSVNGGGNKIEVNTNWRSVCPNPGRNYNSGGSSPPSSNVGGGGGGGGGSCSDNPPNSQYTCAQQASWNKCGESWMQNYCHKSCGRCTSSCTDDPPSGQYTCSQQASWNKCGESWMQNYCHRSCGRCRSSLTDDLSNEVNDGSNGHSLSSVAIALIVVGSIAFVIIVILLVRTLQHKKPEIA